MTIRNLDPLIRPRNLALIGASAEPGSIGAIVLGNALGTFNGPIYAVNPHEVKIVGANWASSVAALPEAPDLAVVMTPAPSVPGIIADLGARGNRCAVILSSGISDANGLRQKVLDAAKPHILRLVGPNCLGVMAPHAGLNATFASATARPGRIAFISQSGALVTAILDWAGTRGIGFSGIVSVGDMIDVDMGDLVAFFAADPMTDAILLYVEGITHADKFMSAAQAATRTKPVIAIKAGRTAEGGRAAFSHTGALAGSDDVYRAAFDRAGIVTVDTLTGLFDAAEILCAYRHAEGNRLGIITNGGGAGILAVDALAGSRARLADVTVGTCSMLDAVLPAAWSHGNPVDIAGDAGPGRYRSAIRPLLSDEGVDALLVMHCPTATAKADDVAREVADQLTRARAAGIAKPVLGCWLGDANAAAARGTLNAAGIPLYTTPDDAVRAFGYLLAADRARSMLNEPPIAGRTSKRDVDAARAIIAQVRSDGRTVLTEIEALALLEAYHVPTSATRFAPTVEAVEQACAGLSPPFALKLVSPDISHKSDVGGVVLNLATPAAAAVAARSMAERITRGHPQARISGYAVQPMCRRTHSHELIVGIATDPTFGPLLMVGSGGTAVEILADKVIGLPPVDQAGARSMIAATRAARLLAGYRNEPAADVDAVAKVLEALSAMVLDLPDLVELDINPLLASPDGVIALDARIRIAPEAGGEATSAVRLTLPAKAAWTPGAS